MIDAATINDCAKFIWEREQMNLPGTQRVPWSRALASQRRKCRNAARSAIIFLQTRGTA